MKKILIVDDELHMTNSLFRALRSENYDIQIANSGQEALSILSDFHPDLLLVDIVMPDTDGYELCRKIRNEMGDKELKIIIISGIIQVQKTERVLSFNADAYFSKPFTNELLQEKVKELLGE